jgi:hypothetical protein
MGGNMPATGLTARVKKAVNVHLGNVKGKVIGSLPAGAVIDVFDCTKSACRIPFQNIQGFVARSYLDVGGGGQTSGQGQAGFQLEIPLPGNGNKVIIAVTPPEQQVTPPEQQFTLPEPQITSFAGVWDSRTDKDWGYVLTLNQNGAKVSGTYVAQDGSNGTINGTVEGTLLGYTWTADGGFAGTGSFNMTSDGVMDGMYTTSAYPDPNMDDYYKTGSWHAERR